VKKTESFEFVVEIDAETSQNVAVDAVDEAEARSQLAELYPGYAFTLNDRVEE
jgi:hypothetical protein